MTILPTNRKDIRGFLAEIFATELVGTGLPCKAVVPYEPHDFKASPVLGILPAGSNRVPLGQGDSPYSNRFYLELRLYVPDADLSIGWTPAQVEDALDDTEAIIARIIRDNRSTAYWTNLAYAAEDVRTDIQPVKIGGRMFNVERTQIIVEVDDAEINPG